MTSDSHPKTQTINLNVSFFSPDRVFGEVLGDETHRCVGVASFGRRVYQDVVSSAFYYLKRTTHERVFIDIQDNATNKPKLNETLQDTISDVFELDTLESRFSEQVNYNNTYSADGTEFLVSTDPACSRPASLFGLSVNESPFTSTITTSGMNDIPYVVESIDSNTNLTASNSSSMQRSTTSASYSRGSQTQRAFTPAYQEIRQASMDLSKLSRHSETLEASQEQVLNTFLDSIPADPFKKVLPNHKSSTDIPSDSPSHGSSHSHRTSTLFQNFRVSKNVVSEHSIAISHRQTICTEIPGISSKLYVPKETAREQTVYSALSQAGDLDGASLVDLTNSADDTDLEKESDDSENTETVHDGNEDEDEDVEHDLTDTGSLDVNGNVTGEEQTPKTTVEPVSKESLDLDSDDDDVEHSSSFGPSQGHQQEMFAKAQGQTEEMNRLAKEKVLQAISESEISMKLYSQDDKSSQAETDLDQSSISLSTDLNQEPFHGAEFLHFFHRHHAPASVTNANTSSTSSSNTSKRGKKFHRSSLHAESQDDSGLDNQDESQKNPHHHGEDVATDDESFETLELDMFEDSKLDEHESVLTDNVLTTVSSLDLSVNKHLSNVLSAKHTTPTDEFVGSADVSKNDQSTANTGTGTGSTFNQSHSSDEPVKTSSKTPYAIVDTSDVSFYSKIVPSPAFHFSYPLDPFQQRAIMRLEQGQDVFVTAHTSAGKTTVAEYAIALSGRHLTKTLYTSPIKTLSNQKFRDFSATFGSESVGIVTGDISIRPEAPCVVLTTEVLRSMLYRGADLIRDVEFVIVDEAHYINDRDRGVVWEEVLIMLPRKVRLVLLSATVPNVLDFANWIGSLRRNPVFVISTARRPVPLQYFLWSKDDMFQIVDENLVFNESTYSGLLKYIKETEKEKINKLKDAGKGQLVHTKGYGKAGGSAKHTINWRQIVMFAQEKELTPFVGFLFSRKACEDAAYSLGDLRLLASDDASRVALFFDNALKRLPAGDRGLPQVLRVRSLAIRGIGVHHAALLPLLKEIIEILASRGLIRVLFATETFAMGVNSPTKMVVFSALSKFDGERRRPLEPGEFTQMAGRAGRRGLDRVGLVTILCPSSSAQFPTSAELRTVILGKPPPLVSKFRLSYAMILNILRQEYLKIEDIMSNSFLEAKTAPDEEKIQIMKSTEALIETMTNDVAHMVRFIAPLLHPYMNSNSFAESTFQFQAEDKIKWTAGSKPAAKVVTKITPDPNHHSLSTTSTSVRRFLSLSTDVILSSEAYFDALYKNVELRKILFSPGRVFCARPDIRSLIHPGTGSGSGVTGPKARFSDPALSVLPQYLNKAQLIQSIGSCIATIIPKPSLRDAGHVPEFKEAIPTASVLAVVLLPPLPIIHAQNQSQIEDTPKQLLNSALYMMDAINEYSTWTVLSPSPTLIDPVIGMSVFGETISTTSTATTKTTSNASSSEYVSPFLAKTINRFENWFLDANSLRDGVVGGDSGFSVNRKEKVPFFSPQSTQESREECVQSYLETAGLPYCQSRFAIVCRIPVTSFDSLIEENVTKKIVAQSPAILSHYNFITESDTTHSNPDVVTGTGTNSLSDEEKVVKNPFSQASLVNGTLLFDVERSMFSVSIASEPSVSRFVCPKLFLSAKGGETESMRSFQFSISPYQHPAGIVVVPTFFQVFTQQNQLQQSETTNTGHGQIQDHSQDYHYFVKATVKNELLFVQATKAWTTYALSLARQARNLKTSIREMQSINGAYSVILREEYEMRRSVLSELNYITSSGAVTQKGRVGCELSTCDALLLSEIILQNTLAPLTAEECVAVLSVLIFQEKSNSDKLPVHMENLLKPIQATALAIGELQYELGASISAPSPGRYVLENISTGMMLASYEWARGMPFSNICQITTVSEGSIVRCISRIAETCRDIGSAARVVGDIELGLKMKHAIELIKRDVIFTASLYLA